MTSFKNFRNRAQEPRASEDGSPLANNDGAATKAPSTATELGPRHLEILREIEQEGEPLSLAEELAELAEHGGFDGEVKLDKVGKQGQTHIAELQKMSMPELIEEARKENLSEVSGMKRQDLIFRILKERVKMNGLMYGEGTLEILPDGFGFLRSPDYHYLSCPDDIYVSPSQIRRFGLRTGSTVSGQIRPPKENERYFALLRVEAINYLDPNAASSRVSFDDLTPLHPDKRIVMEHDPDDMSTRVVDLVTPIGFGQRG
jgi:transcription termination factor Rho